MKKLVLFILIIFISFLAFKLYIIFDRPIRTSPYSYKISIDYKKHGINIKEIETAQILFVGDQLCKSLERFFPTIVEKLSTNLKDAISIQSLCSPQEGIHRTIDRLKALKKLPPIVVYLGGSEENIEQKFEIKDYLKIKRNWDKFSDKKLETILTVAPIASKLIYNKETIIQLNDQIKIQKLELDNSAQMYFQELRYRIFAQEFLDFSKLIREKNSELIVILPPINLELTPKIVCDNSISSSIISTQKEIQNLLQNDFFKEALDKSLTLVNSSLGNAKSYYLLGLCQIKAGNFIEANNAFEMSSAYDCDPNRVNKVIHSIIEKTTLDKNITTIDFNRVVASSLGENTLFIDEIHPQDIYYQQAINGLIEKIKKIMAL